MGVADAIRRAFGRKGVLDPQGPYATTNSVFGQPISYEQILGLTPEELWRTQPYLRTVVTFIARNIAQLGLHTFQRVADTDRRRLRDHPVPLLLSRPNSYTTSYELIYQLVADLALYDDAYWFLQETDEFPSGWKIDRIPPRWIVATKGGDAFTPKVFVAQPPNRPDRVDLPADRILHFHGWSPDDPKAGASPVEALKQILAEQVHAQQYREQVWQRGGRVGTVLTRPPGVEWSDTARERFAQDWKAKWTGDNGPKAGGTPILEDGMTLARVGFSAHEEEFVEAAKLALTVVASVYHVNPTMIGLLDNANYSNVREFRRMLYGDTLGPVMAQLEDRINAFLVPRLTTDEGVYTEFNIEEKLQGSFEEQQQALSSAVGRPYMTANEARAMRNMPALGGDADSLVTPLNVLVGGQTSPRDSGSQNLASGAARVKARAPKTHTTKIEQVLAAFFRRQAKVVKSRLGAKAGDEWWDEQRWDTELSDDLFALAMTVSQQVAKATLDSLGVEPDQYDPDRTVKFLRAVSDRVAGQINSTTKRQIDEVLAADGPDAVAAVFDTAEGSRASNAALSLTTMLSGFGTTEAATQVTGGKATKTWVVQSGNPRSSHAAMDGETVPLDEAFSNGAMWPGDGVLDVDETAGCQCDLVVNIP